MEGIRMCFENTRCQSELWCNFYISKFGVIFSHYFCLPQDKLMSKDWLEFEMTNILTQSMCNQKGSGHKTSNNEQK
jgi:hypothetical protein